MRIGFVLAEIYTGSSLNLWPSVARKFSSDGKDSLIIFPGGRLGEKQNTIFDLVNTDNLDGSIIWSSSLTGEVDSEAVARRFEGLSGRPLVTISGKTEAFPDIPDVTFDTTEGTSALVRNCLNHGARRIAYIRGPKNHKSANERFESFKKTFTELGGEIDMSLITEPAQWSEGAQGIRTIVAERNKLPGRDFDALFGASDLVLYEAMQELMALNVNIPDNFLFCGFNDSIEVRLMNYPISTVRLPSSMLGTNAVSMLRDIFSGKPVNDMVLKAVPVIRRSLWSNGESGKGIKTAGGLVDYISESFSIPWGDADAMIEKIGRVPSEENISECLISLLSMRSEMMDITNVLESISNGGFISKEKEKTILETIRRVFPAVLDRVINEERYRARKLNNAVNAFNDRLLLTQSVKEIADLLENSAPSLGFEKIKLFINKDDGVLEVQTGRIIPSDKMVATEKGVWVAAPLCSDMEGLGYLLMKPEDLNGKICEQIRSMVSSAVRSAFLFEQAREARRRAEEAEQARIMFFANVGENLRNPLSEIADIVGSSSLDTKTRSAVLDRVRGAGRTLDLVLSSIGEVELNRYMADIRNTLSAFEGYTDRGPVANLLMDEDKIREAVSILVTQMGGASIESSMTRRGVKIEIKDISGKWEGTDDVDFSLARKIILMHKGTFSFTKGHFEFCLPYPTLSGSDPVQWREDGVLAGLNGLPEESIESCGMVVAEGEKLPDEAGAIYWDCGFRGYKALVALLALLENPQASVLPFICFECPRTKTLESSIRQLISSGGKTVLQIGSAPEGTGRLLKEFETIYGEYQDAVYLCRKHDPGLILVFIKDRGAADFIRHFRTSMGSSRITMVLCADSFDPDFVDEIADFPNVILANNCILESKEFIMRLRAIMGGSPVLGYLTGMIVKKAQAYICSHATLPLSRWQIAEEVHVSEDYLTRVFKKELGVSPWDCLNRYRVAIASDMLRNTGMSINEISQAAGFQDQAYFCRVFKKVRGINPGKLRNGSRIE